VISLVRAASAAFYVSMRLRVVSSFAVLAWLFFPFIFAVVGLYVFARPGNATPQLVYGVLGGGLIGYFGVAYLDGGQGIQDERWNGTLEQVFAVPTPLWVILLGKVCGSILWGMLSFVPTIAIAYFGFHALVPHLDTLRFAVSFAVLTFSMLAISLALAPLYALWRWALPMFNGFEFGFCILCGFMFPVTLLPVWAQLAAGVLAPTWATRALYASTTIGGPHDYVAWWLIALGLSVLYIAGALVLYRLIDRRARMSGELALA
jgi:ABC-2 type transport system permease protein